jgi:hypothetical protein
MISEPVAKLLVAQIAHELTAHTTYMGIALYFERASLKGWAKLFHDQAVEEAGHGSKIMSFLIDNDVEFALPAAARRPPTPAREPRSRRRWRASRRFPGCSTPWRAPPVTRATIAAPSSCSGSSPSRSRRSAP